MYASSAGKWALAKLMWILGQTNDFEKVKALFYRQVHHDILCKEP